MDSRHMTDNSLPAHLAPIRPTMPLPRSSHPIEGPKPFRARVVGTGLARYWKFVLPLWLVGSAAGMVLVYYKVKASYEAVSLVRIDPGLVLFSSSGANNTAAVNQFLSTQVNLFKSNQVLKMALDDQKVKDLAMVRNAEDPMILLRDALWLNVRPNTYLVDVGMRADSLMEAETIVDSIVNNYVEYQESTNAKASDRVIRNLESYKRKLESRITTAENDITATVDVHGYYSKGLAKRPPRPKGDGEAGEPGDQVGRDIKIREEEFRGVVLNCLQAEMRLGEAEAYLEGLRKRIEARGEDDEAIGRAAMAKAEDDVHRARAAHDAAVRTMRAIESSSAAKGHQSVRVSKVVPAAELDVLGEKLRDLDRLILNLDLRVEEWREGGAVLIIDPARASLARDDRPWLMALTPIALLAIIWPGCALLKMARGTANDAPSGRSPGTFEA